ncbi:MAG: hypothetical protein RL141_688, partial [Candidatus Parcubacteria bacterium]
YNIATAATKHLFLGDEVIATITGTGATAQVQYALTDHLSGSSVVTSATGSIIELMDYYPFGGIRLDQKTTAFSEQRKYIGQEYDAATDLTYMNARYQSGKGGRFVSQDPSFLDIGKTGFEQRYGRTLQQHLANPQALNSYNYALNNPIVYSDPSGEIVPFILAAWAIAEVGLTLYDAYSTYQTVSDPNASQTEKAAAGALFIGGLIGPGGGYKTVGSKIDDVAKGLSRGIKSSPLGVEGSYSRAAEHILRDHPTRYPGFSKEAIASMAKETHDTANLSSRIKGTDPLTGLSVDKQYYGSSKTGQIFINTNNGSPTMFPKGAQSTYIKNHTSDDMSKYGKRK